MRRLFVASLVSAVGVLAGALPPGMATIAQSGASFGPPSRSCPWTDSYWGINATQMTVTRSASWQSAGTTMTMRETDRPLTITFGRFDRPIQVNATCHSAVFYLLVEHLPMTRSLVGSWSDPSASPPQRSCTASAPDRGPNGWELRATTHGVITRDQFFFNPRSPRTTFELLVDLPFGLSCNVPGGKFQFDWPIPHTLPFVTAPTPIRTALLTHDRRFSMPVQSILMHTEPSGDFGGTVHMTLSLAGRVTFVPLGCDTRTDLRHYPRPGC